MSLVYNKVYSKQLSGWRLMLLWWWVTACVLQVANQKFADVVLEHYQANDIM
jgi:hypothetical protein